MNSVLITGGTGFLARGLVRRLLEDGCQRICIYSRGEFAQARMRAEFKNEPRLRWFIGDVRDRSRLEEAMERVEAVVHAAALKRIEVGATQPAEMFKTNIDGSENVIKAAQKAGVLRALLVSSDKAFEPISPYGQSKAAAETLFLTTNDRSPYGPRFSVVRYGNVWNSTGSVVPTWRELIAAGEKEVPVTDPTCTRFFMRLSEAVDLVLNTLKNMRGGEVEVPTLPAYAVGDLAAAMNVGMRVSGLPPHEKRHEAMAPGNSSDVARRMTVEELRGALQSI